VFNNISFKKVIFLPITLYYRHKFSDFDICGSSIIKLFKIRGGEECSLKIGSESVVLSALHFDRNGAIITIGSNSFIGKSNLVASKKIWIGDRVLISWGVTIVDHNSHSIVYSQRSSDVADWRNGSKDWSNVVCESVTIADKAWIGFNSIILKGVTIGEGAVVGAGSVVTKDVPPWTIVGGNPAKIIREIPENER
jgi:acetyltransferase-like isoleucine patch superfamily enzyme